MFAALAALAFLYRQGVCEKQTFIARVIRPSGHLDIKRLFWPGFVGVFRTDWRGPYMVAVDRLDTIGFLRCGAALFKNEREHAGRECRAGPRRSPAC